MKGLEVVLSEVASFSLYRPNCESFKYIVHFLNESICTYECADVHNTAQVSREI